MIVLISCAGLMMGADGGCFGSRDTTSGSGGGSGSTGACATVSDCSNLTHIECAGRWLCESAQCTWDCAYVQCKTDADCKSGAKPAMACASGAEIKATCKAGSCAWVCDDVTTCKSDAECPAGQRCRQDMCPMMPCAVKADGTADCPPCYGTCVTADVNCTTDADCPDGYYCQFQAVYDSSGNAVPGCAGSGGGSTGSGGSSGGTVPGGKSLTCINPGGVCVQKPIEQKCTADTDCPAGYYCAVPQMGGGSTDPNGGTTRCFGLKCVVPTEGTCIPYESCVCPEIYGPVCGTDGVTYGNECFAKCAGVGIAHDGECQQTCECAGVSNAVCGKDYQCDPGYTCDAATGGCCKCSGETCKPELVCTSDGDCPIGVTGWSCVNGCCQLLGCACALYYDPVCGTDGVTYGNDCEAKCAGVGIAYKGQCKNGCYSDADCPVGLVCNAATVCNPPPGCDPSKGMACPAVCYGYCEPAQKACLSDADCPAGYTCMMTNCGDPSTNCGGGGGVCMPVCKDLPACTIDCQYGFKKDANGCEICECETCPPVACDLYCQYGFATDPTTGCEICRCNQPPCETFTDANGNICSRCFNPDGSVTLTCSGSACANNMPVCKTDKDCPIGVDGYSCVNGCCQITGCACPLYYSPVCGSDGATYGNECEAKCAGVTVAYTGACHGECVETYAACKDDTMCPKDYACFNGACCKPL